jgi:hypothetical protein
MAQLLHSIHPLCDRTVQDKGMLTDKACIQEARNQLGLQEPHLTYGVGVQHIIRALRT